jgi:hypothetical protein
MGKSTIFLELFPAIRFNLFVLAKTKRIFTANEIHRTHIKSKTCEVIWAKCKMHSTIVKKCLY